ncbi:uncharacterized protein LOC143996942 [Lithobates pipiens]
MKPVKLYFSTTLMYFLLKVARHAAFGTAENLTTCAQRQESSQMANAESLGEKRIGTYEDTMNPTPNEEGEELTTQPEDVDSEVQEVVETTASEFYTSYLCNIE